MSDEAAFVRAIIDDPDDDANRRVFADWLEDRGDERAELIRAQLEWEEDVRKHPMRDEWHWVSLRLALSDAGDWGSGRSSLLVMLSDVAAISGEADASEADGLIEEHGAEWAADVAPLVEKYAFRRGLLERVRLTPAQLLEHGEALFRRAPILELTVPTAHDDPPGLLAKALSLPALAQLTHLHLPGVASGPSVAEAMAGATHLKRLTSLWLEVCHVGSEGLARLAGCRHLRTLTELHLEDNHVGPDGVRALTASPHLTRLRRLYLGENSVTDEGAALLAGWKRLKQLEALDLGHARLSVAGAERLGASVCRPATLLLDNNWLAGGGCEALSAGRLLSHVQVLDLTDGRLVGSDSAAPLLAGLGRETIRVLGLGSNSFGDEGLAVLAASQKLRDLRALNLSDGRFGVEGLRSLFASAQMPRLVWLDLARCGIDAEAMAELVRHPAQLKPLHLDLGDNDLGDDGVAALAGWDALEDVTSLSLVEVGMGDRGARALAASPHLDLLLSLDAYGNRLGPKGKAALRKRFGDEADVG
jgi:uncharacterized protein (TIGR02996 family)